MALTDTEHFTFTLAGHLGMTVAELESKMSTSEFFKWIEYFKDKPPTMNTLLERMEIQELQMAQLLAMTHNANAKRPIKPMEFIYSIDNEEKAKIKQEQLQKDLMRDLDKMF